MTFDQTSPSGTAAGTAGFSERDEIAAIEAEFDGWHVWRATRSFGEPGDYVATRRDLSAGTYPTVMADSADELRAELAEQRRMRAEPGGYRRR